jgi:hypothetical protein
MTANKNLQMSMTQRKKHLKKKKSKEKSKLMNKNGMIFRIMIAK